jgi:hypothetical protein
MTGAQHAIRRSLKEQKSEAGGTGSTGEICD